MNAVPVTDHFDGNKSHIVILFVLLLTTSAQSKPPNEVWSTNQSAVDDAHDSCGHQHAP